MRTQLKARLRLPPDSPRAQIIVDRERGSVRGDQRRGARGEPSSPGPSAGGRRSILEWVLCLHSVFVHNDRSHCARHLNG
eukprot:scaffold215978_cov25-Tisochrysis_lutea.AAC.1